MQHALLAVGQESGKITAEIIDITLIQNDLFELEIEGVPVQANILSDCPPVGAAKSGKGVSYKGELE